MPRATKIDRRKALALVSPRRPQPLPLSESRPQPQLQCALTDAGRSKWPLDDLTSGTGNILGRRTGALKQYLDGDRHSEAVTTYYSQLGIPLPRRGIIGTKRPQGTEAVR